MKCKAHEINQNDDADNHFHGCIHGTRLLKIGWLDFRTSPATEGKL